MTALDLLPERAGERGVEGVGDAEAFVAADDADVDEFFRVRDGQAAHADFVEELEDGGVGSDAERERCDGGWRT